MLTILVVVVGFIVYSWNEHREERKRRMIQEQEDSEDEHKKRRHVRFRKEK